ncbi:MAG TPA: Gfo/Idh/MocA family oxidoreductase [Bryobacteraceae bacterium]|nr:Gfo/Idh/MocA family oxidoreductase [Bryobacteraceae bacterium]
MSNRDVSRRAFVALPAAAILANARAQSATDTVRVAFIGLGNRGAYLLQHMKNVPGVKIVALCDINPDTLAKAAAATPGASTATDYRQLLDRTDIDAVVIATPVDTHRDLAVAALDSAKHVYSEKPMALTPEECRAIVTTAKSAKGIYQAGFQLRHDPNRHASMDFIHKGGIGRVLYCQGYRHTGDLPHQIAWYFDAKRSGNNIVEQACHILDLFTWAVGDHPLRAMGSGGINLYKNDPPGRTTFDNYSVIYEFPNDVRLTFSHIYFDPDGFSGIRERVFGSQGAIDLAAATWRELGKRKAEPIKLTVPDAGQDSTYLSLAAFIENARGRKKPLNDAESARRSTLVGLMGRKAIDEKRIVTWEEVDL